jgi:hypothetical protein
MRQNSDVHFLKRRNDYPGPCVSLYLPTHRRHPDNQQDPIRYRNLLSHMKRLITEGNGDGSMSEMLARFEELGEDLRFWNHRTDGVAIFGSSEIFEIFDLQRSVSELLVVADSFHIKPLLRIQQSADRFQVLGINRHEVRLYEGNRDALDEVELATGVPRTLTEALGDEVTEPHLTVARYGGGNSGSGNSGAHGGPAMFHGHGGKKDEVELDNERFFGVVDRAIMEHHSQPSGLPLILAALPEHHDLFHTVSHNRFLIPQSIAVDPAAASIDQLRDEAWKILLPRYEERLAKLTEDFQTAFASNRGASDLSDIAAALIAGRVGWLLVEADRHIPGRLNRTSGQLQFGNPDDSEMDDLLDDLAEVTLTTGGEVIVVPTDRMPTTTGAAATFRF